jgi:hypothetical protein
MAPCGKSASEKAAVAVLACTSPESWSKAWGVAKREEMGSREAANGRAGIERNGKETPFLA